MSAAIRLGNGASSTGETHASAGFERYTFAERLVHWFVALTFTALMLSGFALGYPRAYFLSGLFGGGQTMRFLHPWFGVGFTLGILWMLVSWWRDMRMTPVDKQWVRKMKTYAGTGHSGLDVGRYNAGQKGFYWFSVLLGVVLFVTGLPLWYPWLLDNNGLNHLARFTHHAAFLLMVGGYIVHVYMSTVMFPGTLSAMTTGRVSRAWAAFHHPAWFRVQDRRKAGASN
ncbi:MAG TPA: formate dehydrogenase subunit gamma [Acidimicrobiia bacterium]|nr:formate dehydrogenase subunit gamma [Acidimicrobiia bacterium]